MIDNEKVNIEGIAKEAKLGAILLTESCDIYYIEGLKRWKSKYLNKKLVVSGYLIEIQEFKINDSIFISQSKPSRKTIIDAKFKIIK